MPPKTRPKHLLTSSLKDNAAISLSTSHFYSFLMDGASDFGKIEDELIIVMTFCKEDAAGKVKSCARYFSDEEHKKADAEGLSASLRRHYDRVDNVLNKSSVLNGKPILIGGVADGAISEQNGILHRELPWLFWVWCYSHRLELVYKDSFTSEMLMTWSFIRTISTPSLLRNLGSSVMSVT